MANRQAIDTIRGYLFQFDNTILQILNIEDENSIFTIEGVEDIDITDHQEETIAIQCKYYQESDFQPSIIKDAIGWMVKDFAERLANKKNLIKYKLYGHYKSGHERLANPLEVADLKKVFLTTVTRGRDDKPSETKEIHVDLNLTDDDLKIFLLHLEIDIEAPTLEEQHSQVIKKIVDIGLSSTSDAVFFYSKSLYIIRNLAKSKDETMRKITKKTFISNLKDSKKILFDFWFAHQKEMSNYCRMIKNKYFSDSQSPKSRFFLIDKSNLQDNELLELIKSISDKWSSGRRTVREPDKFCPFIYIHQIEEFSLLKLKNDLINDGYLFEDGHYYRGANFNVKLFLRDIVERENQYRAKLKIINNMDELSSVIEKKPKNINIYEFFSNAPYTNLDESIKVYFKNYDYLKGVLV
ncbi:hypothetical protein EA736_06075 [Acinetobacter baumannii]|uniref:DUF4297 family anti-phage-associated protein n=1 Tax=Acinetobacter baumannii TaxID=470 RepID=UPI0002BC1753|nr:DUF4297 family anti-phage-associated protein [Acinetobacter baumannii]RSP54139.1 hypothetical protein EA736_06075 [Acinetobacter baumannii]